MTNEVRFADRVAGLTGSVAREILSRTENREVISFAGGLPDDSLWQNDSGLAVDASGFQYGPSEGDKRLREVFAKRMQRNGLKVDFASTLVLSGSQQGLDLAAKLLLDKGSVVLVESPTYLAALQVFRLFEARIVPVEMDEDGVSIAALSEAIAREKPSLVYLNPSFQNPSGLCYSELRRKEVAGVMDQSAAVLLEDDPYRELVFEGKVGPPIVSHMKTGNWIYLNSVSKILMPGLRLGCLACSDRLFDPLMMLKQAADLHTSRTSQALAYDLLSQEAKLKESLDYKKKLYRGKRDEMQKSLERWLSGLVDWTTPKGGMFFWLVLKKETDLKQLMEDCLQRGVAIMPGNDFFAAKEYEGRCIRLNFTKPRIEEIERGARIVAEEIAKRVSGIS